MRLKRRQLGSASVVDIRGPLCGRPVGAILAAVREEVCGAPAPAIVVLNLEGVSSVDVAGLEALVEARSMLRSAGGALKLARITKSVRERVVGTRLLAMFEVFDSVEEAAASGTLGVAVAQPPSMPWSRNSLGAIPLALRQA